MVYQFFILFLRRIFFLLLIYTSSRVALFLNNIASFSSATLWDFIEGLRFDISALFYINLPFFLLVVFPTNFRTNKRFQQFLNILFYTINIPFILFNNIDIEYFHFTQKRSTIDLFQLLQLGNDAQNIIPQYIKDYWPITLLSIVQIWFLLKIKKLPSTKTKLHTKIFISNLLLFLFACGITIIGMRGGLQLKPIKPINAGELSNSENNSLILNTPFCILQSINAQQLHSLHYFSASELDQIYSPIHQYSSSSGFQKKNVVILIMESLSAEFVGKLNGGISYTPFLDSLMQHSLVCTNAFASGLKSIEGLPSITSSIPSLMDNPFITSNYAQNRFQSLASILTKEGYVSSFFHGGFTGTMGFDGFCRKAGYQQYFGLEEYNNMQDFDGTWGIFDEEFFNYFHQHLKKEKEPFFSTFFSATLHPPFVIPPKYKGRFQQKQEVHQTAAYSDFALKSFFEKAKKEKWFQNTIFVITADHTCGTRLEKKYSSKIGRYAIPIVFFSGDGSLAATQHNIVQQTDIMPTILDILGYEKPFFAFGKSVLANESWALSYLQEHYYFISNHGIIVNKEEKYNMFDDWELTHKIPLNEEDLEKLKAIKQTYNNRMINNQLFNEN